MTKTEKKLIAQFLDKFGDHLSNRSCNDFYVQCTEENLELLEEFEDWASSDDPQYSLGKPDAQDRVCVMDWHLCMFLAHKLRKEEE